MTSVVRQVVLAAAALLAAGCGNSSGASPGREAGDAAPDAAVTDPACKENVILDSMLSGSCVAGATCHIQTKNEMQCPDGWVDKGAPTIWDCTCPGSWICTVVGGGFHVPTCWGHGADGGPVAPDQ